MHGIVLCELVCVCVCARELIIASKCTNKYTHSRTHMHTVNYKYVHGADSVQTKVCANTRAHICDVVHMCVCVWNLLAGGRRDVVEWRNRVR